MEQAVMNELTEQLKESLDNLDSDYDAELAALKALHERCQSILDNGLRGHKDAARRRSDSRFVN
jgi:hypothetical protein